MKLTKALRSDMETRIISSNEVIEWRIPPFQRAIRVNQKVLDLVEELKIKGGIIPGIITLGRLPADPATYVVDGQHRIEAFTLSQMPEAIADCRTIHFDSMSDMAEEFVKLNSRLVNMRPDDVLRGLAQSDPLLQRILKACPFVGFDQVRRGHDASPVVGMSVLLRAWHGSSKDTPGVGSISAASVLKELTPLDVDHLIEYMGMAYSAWRRDPEYNRLWGALNMTMTMWMYRRLVLGEHSTTAKRAAHFTKAQFVKGLVALTNTSAVTNYIDWLQGHTMGDRDRGPAYNRIKDAFAHALQADTGVRPKFPQPAWVTG